jgi:hypothetical protein
MTDMRGASAAKTPEMPARSNNIADMALHLPNF